MRAACYQIGNGISVIDFRVQKTNVVQQQSYGIKIRADIDVLNTVLILFGCRIDAIASHRRVVTVTIAKSQIDEFDVVRDAGEHDIVGLQIKMKHLMMMQITQAFQQLREKTPNVLRIGEVRGILYHSIPKCFPIDVFHDDVASIHILSHRNILHQMFMRQALTSLKLLAKKFQIARIVGILATQTFHEVSFALIPHQIA